MTSGPRFRRALVVEDQMAVRAWLVDLLKQAFIELHVDEAGDVATALRLLADEPYDIALVDIGLPDASGMEVIRHLAEAHPSTQIVVTTIHDDDDHVFSAMAAGASGYLLKDQPAGTLVRQLQQLERDGICALSPSVARRLLAHFRKGERMGNPPSGASLSPRETEVLTYLGKGLRIHEVAKLLGVAENTVSTYVKNIYRKLDISSRAEAALEASRRGLV